MRTFLIAKVLTFLFIGLSILIPVWITYFDNGEVTISMEEFLNPKTKLTSLNLIITGRPLFEYSF